MCKQVGVLHSILASEQLLNLLMQKIYYIFCVHVAFLAKMSKAKIKKGGEGVFSGINDFTGKSLISFSTPYSTLLYSTTTNLHFYYYLTTTFLANCKESTTFFAGVVL